MKYSSVIIIFITHLIFCILHFCISLLGIRKMLLGIRKMFLGIRKNIEAGMQENMVFKNMVGHGVCGDALGHAHHIF